MMKAMVRERARAVATVLVTLFVVGLEFVLLTSVYHSDDRVDRQHEAQVRVAAVLDANRPDAGELRSATRELVRTDPDSVGRLVSGVRAWIADPEPSRLGVARGASDALGDRLDSAQRWADIRAALVHAASLVLVSVGWFLWFRRLVRRHRELERAVTESQLEVDGERRLLALVQNSADMVAVLEPDSTMTFVSPASVAVLGRTPESLTGHKLAHQLNMADMPVFIGQLAASREGDQGVMLRVAHADGRELVLEGTLTNLMSEPAVNGWVLTLRDVTDRLSLQEELSHQAFHDALTGLANRRLFGDRLAHALRPRGRDGEPLAVLFLDLDDFKNVNDSVGHGTGDELLVTVAQRISSCIRQGDTAARLGGDEFAILMEDADLATAREVAARHAPVEVGGGRHSVRASIGIAEAVPGETSGEDALRNADVAMYWAKDRGKGTIAVYESDLHEQALDQLALRSELQVAIRSDQLRLHFQPTVDLKSGEIAGFEALVRWQHPTRGLVPPGDFIPAAEQSGLVVPLGSWVLREACLAGLTLRNGVHAPSIAVNVAGAQLTKPGFVDEVLEVLRETELPADRLVLEITEGTLLDDKPTIVDVLALLRERGVRVAIDDFGTGYSSLAYLADLPVDVLKIDKAFVDQVTGGESLVPAILAMADKLKLSTVAEGVENVAQAEWLGAANCTLGQGYLWSRPVPLDEARALLEVGGGSRGKHAGPASETSHLAVAG
jgi:diguanylate cyclase (GGDEF)-like protein/PAS domain S-box-containing protein